MTGQELGAVYSEAELASMLGSAGENVSINRSVVFYSPKRIRIGSNVRIDCFSLISAGESGIDIGDHVHISSYCYLNGSGGRIQLSAFSGVSSRASILTATDDFTGGFLTGPTVPDKFRNVRGGDVIVEKHAVIGAGSVILPGVTIGLGATIGALSLVRKSVPECTVAAGNPLRTLRQRDRGFLDLETEFLSG